MRWRELVLHRNQTVAENPTGGVNLRIVHARDAGEPNHALIQQGFQRADRILIRNRGVRAMRIQQIERVDAEAESGLLRVTNHRLRARVGHPPVPAAGRLQVLSLGCGCARAVARGLLRIFRVAVRHFQRSAITSLRGDQNLIARTAPAGERRMNQHLAVPEITRHACTVRPRFAWQIIRPCGVEITHSGVKRGMDRADGRRPVRASSIESAIVPMPRRGMRAFPANSTMFDVTMPPSSHATRTQGRLAMRQPMSPGPGSFRLVPAKVPSEHSNGTLAGWVDFTSRVRPRQSTKSAGHRIGDRPASYADPLIQRRGSRRRRAASAAPAPTASSAANAPNTPLTEAPVFDRPGCLLPASGLFGFTVSSAQSASSVRSVRSACSVRSARTSP